MHLNPGLPETQYDKPDIFQQLATAAAAVQTGFHGQRDSWQPAAAANDSWSAVPPELGGKRSADLTATGRCRLYCTYRTNILPLTLLVPGVNFVTVCKKGISHFLN